MGAGGFQYIENLSEETLVGAVGSTASGAGFVLFLPESEGHQIPWIRATLSARHIPFAGAVFPELIFDSTFRKTGLLLLAFDPMPPYLLAGSLPERVDAVFDELESLFDEKKSRTLFAIFDAMIPNIATLLGELYFRFGDSLAYAGGNCGSETFRPIPSLFDKDRIVERGALFLFLKGREGAVIEHGYKSPERFVTATSASGNRISTIEWKPAFQAYQDYIQDHYGTRITRENFYSYGVHFPFGIIRGDGETLVRIPVEIEGEDSLICVGEIPSNSILTLLQAQDPSSLETAEGVARSLQGTKGDVLLFYCAGRRLHLLEEAVHEISTMSVVLAGRRMAGVLSLGELGNNGGNGYPLFHNATILCAPLGQ